MPEAAQKETKLKRAIHQRFHFSRDRNWYLRSMFGGERWAKGIIIINIVWSILQKDDAGLFLKLESWKSHFGCCAAALVCCVWLAEELRVIQRFCKRGKGNKVLICLTERESGLTRRSIHILTCGWVCLWYVTPNHIACSRWLLLSRARGVFERNCISHRPCWRPNLIWSQWRNQNEAHFFRPPKRTKNAAVPCINVGFQTQNKHQTDVENKITLNQIDKGWMNN